MGGESSRRERLALVLSRLLAALLLALLPLGDAAAGLKEGQAAYTRGDYAEAAAEIVPLAEAGEAAA
jgi:hypothetical protein